MPEKKIDIDINVKEVFSRLKKKLNLKKDKELADVFETKPKNIGMWVYRKKIPLEFLLFVVKKYNLSLDWLVGFNSEDFDTEKYALIPYWDRKLGKLELDLDSIKFTDFYVFKKDWLQKRNINSKKAIVVKVVNNLMSPELVQGDLVLIDLNIEKEYLIENKIYAFYQENVVYFRKLNFEPPNSIALSNNQKTTIIPKEEIKTLSVLGIAKWIGRDI